MTARAFAIREARYSAEIDRLEPAPKSAAPNSRPRIVAALSPFLWLGKRIGLNVSAILRRTRKKRRVKERQRSRGGRAFQLRKELQRQAKKQAIFARLAQPRRADRQPQPPRRTPPRSTPHPPPSQP